MSHNVDWQGTLQGIREAIEKIRSPIDPIRIQGTATRAIADGPVARLSPPGDGYNRCMVFWSGTSDRPKPVYGIYNQPQTSEIFGRITIAQIAGNPPTTSVLPMLVPKDTWSPVFEIPDRDFSVQIQDSSVTVAYAIFWRQF